MIEIERLPAAVVGFVEPPELVTGEIYECVSCPGGYYNGWLLFVSNIGRGDQSIVYGSWINKGAAIFGDYTAGHKDFRFKKLQMKLVEVKE